ncbi:MAG: pyruvate kinase [Candidatus Doudnabacteria bacterium]|nr:pyruvate kinase [Candidatus Doudnabacteria bacterium]
MYKKTKIVCTLGPTSSSVKNITEMVKAGMNVARLNFSHGDYKSHEQLISNVRSVSEKLGLPLAIIQDLHGPKIRVKNLKKPIDVKIGQTVVIGQDFDMDAEVVKSIRPRQHILIEDGLIEMEVSRVVGRKVFCTVLSPGKIQDKKGVNLPRTRLKIPILTEKDIEDLKFGLKQDVDYIALSFVRTAADVRNLKKLIKKYNPKGFEAPKIISKIEKPEAVKNFDAILKESDAVMVARGDLGVEMPESQVPIIQKTIIQKALRAAKPVIVATQMLDSMIRNPRPTRAEVSDVANAVIDQTDCVMLSGETAFGRYPVKTVQQMAKIIEATEKSIFLPGHKHLVEKALSKSEAVAESVYELASSTKAKIIIGATDSGFTAREVAHQRPVMTNIIMLTPKEKTQRQMCLIWGVRSFLVPMVKTYENLLALMIKTAKENKLVKKGEKLIIVTGEPLGMKENLNLVEVKTV